MGTWNIQISGHGTHHNKGRKDDAERLAAKLVLDLRAAGHEVKDALFILTDSNGNPVGGGTEDIREAATYLAAKDLADERK